jgi:hypothetical protein
MFSSSAASTLQYAHRVALTAAGLAIASAQTSAAQTPAPEARSWEFRVSSGAFVPTGDQRNLIKDGQVSAAQLSWVVNPSMAITGTFAWARSRDLTNADTPKIDVFTSDVGVESRPVQWFVNAPVSVSPFVGLGAGVRTYNPRSEGIGTANAAIGYASVGGELGIGRVGVRLEVRDYISNARIAATQSDIRNDVVISAALRFNRQRSQN